MQKKTYLSLSLFVFAVGCGQSTAEEAIPEIQLAIEKSIDQANDSLFFKNLKCLTYASDKVIASESDQAQMFVFSPDLQFQYTIGKQGRGPLELGTADYFAVTGDTIIVKDGENDRMQFFTNTGTHLMRSSDPVSELPSTLSGRFVYRNNQITASARNTAAFAQFDLTHIRPTQYFGLRYPFASIKQESIRNDRHVLADLNGIVAVSDNMPIIERYDHSGKLRETYDFSSIEPVGTQIAHISKQQWDERSYFTLISDCNLSNGQLLVLVETSFDTYLVNSILMFDLSGDNIRPVCVLRLPGKIYTSIAVGRKILYAFNSENNRLESFAL